MKIVFFNDKKLAADLKNKKIKNTEKLFYLLFIVSIVPIVQAFDSMLFGTSKTYSYQDGRVFVGILMLLLDLTPHIIIGYSVVVSYLICARKNGNDLIENFVCLSFPLAIKAILLQFILGIPINFVLALLDELKMTHNSVDTVFDSYFLSITASIYFLLKMKSNIFMIYEDK
jgi:hypothetical protein